MSLAGNCKDVWKGKVFPLMPSLPGMGIANMSAPLGNRNPHASGAGYYYRVQKLDKIAMWAFG